jgi:hypothetical protein
MIEAAVVGLGAGHPVEIGGRALEQPVAYHVLCRRAALDERPIRIFRDWLAADTGRIRHRADAEKVAALEVACLSAGCQKALYTGQATAQRPLPKKGILQFCAWDLSGCGRPGEVSGNLPASADP